MLEWDYSILQAYEKRVFITGADQHSKKLREFPKVILESKVDIYIQIFIYTPNQI